MNGYDVPLRLRGMYEKALAGKLSPRQVIKLGCYHCMGWETKAVKDCTSPGCPAFAYRPGIKRRP
ncbi:MAG: hypothetical protein AMXMBFR13_19580 [Phycisphaerae bacterium]